MPYGKLLAAAGFVLGPDSTKPDTTKNGVVGTEQVHL